MAPSARAVQKAEAKYGVTADYPDLQLHAAAANGNVGLVKYALMHGQPVNSVLNGVLPIHIAASSGNDLVVQMLLDAGADVNAARLPRKYNADRSKAISSIGAAGSTPLHFAAANGHAHIVSLLLSHGANPDATEKHGLTPEDLAREAGHVNVVTVFRLWKQDTNNGTDQSSEAGHHQYLGNEFYSSPPSASGSGYSGGGGKLASSAASIHSVASTSGRKLLSKPSLDSISNKGKKLAKAASNPNLAGLLPSSSSSHSTNHAGPSNSQSPPYTLASSFAQPQVALRQNPSKALANYMQNHPNAPLIHHVINLDKSRRPSLPSVFEKAAHPSQSIKSALGLNSHNNNGRLGGRGGSSSGNDHDPYHLARPHRSSSKTSLSGLFKTHQHNKEKSTESYNSQPLSPAVSTFFTGDDELEQAERDMFLRADAYSDNEGSQNHSPFGGPPTRPGTGSYENRRSSIEGFTSVRSRAGSASSAATSQSNVSYAARMPDSRSLFNYPMTAPPTQTTFTHLETDPPQHGYMSRPTLSAHSSTGSIVIPQAIPAPPSSSTQPFFSKAAISAAHNNNTARPGFYRPRKSSQLSTAASTMSNGNYTFSSPEIDNRSLSHQTRSGGGSSDAEASVDGPPPDNTLVPPALVVRRPTVRDGSTSQGVEDMNRQVRSISASPRQPTTSEPSVAVSPPGSTYGRATQVYNANVSRHARTISDGTGSIRQISSLPDVQESPESQIRLSSQDAVSPSRSGSRGPNEVDRNGRRESEDVFPPNAEPPFPTRSRAGSRARVDSAGSGNAPVSHLNNLTATNSHNSPSLPSLSNFQYGTGGESDGHWKSVTRAHRSDSTTTDTRTSRSGSVGESGGQHHRFFGFDYSSSPTGSTASFKYHPSASTTATSLVSSPPGTAMSVNQGTTVTHAQAQHMVKKKEEELLSYDPSETSEGSSARRPSLSQQLAAYGDSLAIERELHDAERYRQNPHERIALTIPDPPASAKYSWEILGKESRTKMPVSKGQRAREKQEAPSTVVQQQRLWTHRMVSPYEVPLNRPGTHVGGHRHTPSTSTITSSGKPLTRVVSNETTGPSRGGEQLPSIPQSPALPAIHHPGEQGLRNKPSSNLSLSRGYLAPPSGGSDLSIRKSPRVRSISPNYASPRNSGEKDREKPSASYHVVAGPGSEPNDSANSSLVSEPRSAVGLRHHGQGGGSTVTIGSRHRSTRSDPPSASPSPDASHVLDEQTPRPPHLLRLETVMAPKFHIEQKAGGEAAPSPTKVKFGSKFGKLFR